jgi:hypothetical protein
MNGGRCAVWEFLLVVWMLRILSRGRASLSRAPSISHQSPTILSISLPHQSLLSSLPYHLKSIRLFSSRHGSLPIHTPQAVDIAMKLLLEKKLLRKRDLDDLFTTYSESMTLTQLINFFYFCSKKKIILESNQLKKLSTELYSRRGSLEIAQLGKALYSLKLYTGRSLSERELLLTIHSKIDSTLPSLSSQTISNMLYGLHQMNSHRTEIQTLLMTLANLIARSQCQLSGPEIASALYGLQGMDTSHESVRDIVRVLSRKIEVSYAIFTSQVISNALYGLQGMRADNNEVRFLLRVLKYKIDQTTECLTPLSVSNSLYGLKNMTSESGEVRRLLLSLSRVIQMDRVEHRDEDVENITWNDEPLIAQGVACSLYGLQGMSSEHWEVRRLLTALSQRIERTSDTLSSQHIGMSLHGLMRMSSKEPEVRVIVKQLAELISRSKKPIDTHGIALGLYGLSQLSSEHKETLLLLEALTPRIFATQEPFLAITVASALKGFESLRVYDSPVVLGFMKSVFHHIKRCDESFKPVTLCKVIQTLSFCASPSRSPIIAPLAVNEEQQGQGVNLFHQKCQQFLSDLLSDITNKLQTVMKLSPPPTFPVVSLGQAFLGLMDLDPEHPEGKVLKQLLFSNLKRCTETKEQFPLSTALILLRSYQTLGIDTQETKQGRKILLQRISWWGAHLQSLGEETDQEEEMEGKVELDEPKSPPMRGSAKAVKSTDEEMKAFMKNPKGYQVITLSNNAPNRFTFPSGGVEETGGVGVEEEEEKNPLELALSEVTFRDLRRVLELLGSLPVELQESVLRDLVIVTNSLLTHQEEELEAKEFEKRLIEEKKKLRNRPVRKKAAAGGESATEGGEGIEKEEAQRLEQEEEKLSLQRLLQKISGERIEEKLRQSIDTLALRMNHSRR